MKISPKRIKKNKNFNPRKIKIFSRNIKISPLKIKINPRSIEINSRVNFYIILICVSN